MPAAKNEVLLEGIRWCIVSTGQHEALFKALKLEGRSILQ